MKRIWRGIVKHRKLCLIGAVLLSILSGIASLSVPINTDMTKYLPDDSSMKQGIDLMAEEFSSLSLATTIRAMVENLPGEKTAEALDSLKALPNVESAVLTDSREAEGKHYDLFTLSTKYTYQSPEERAIEESIPGLFPEYVVTVRNDNTTGMDIPVFIFVLAGIMLLTILFLMCSSFVEPFLFLAAIGIAIVINMGTNLIFGSVSQVTFSIAAVLQLVLSMDYSIILMNRYRQEKAVWEDKEKAMEMALHQAFPSVASSGFTTFVGLLMLVFMRFKIGMDIGLVLAKGVLLSMLCVLIVLPGLILLFDSAVERTQKKVLKIPTKGLAAFGFRFRKVLTIGFLILFFVSWYLESLAGISYSLSNEDPIADLFPKENQIVLLYDNEDEAAVSALLARYEENPDVHSAFAYSTTIGKQMTAQEMTDYIRTMAEEGGSFAAYLPEDVASGLDEGTSKDLLDRMSPEVFETIYALAGHGKSEEGPGTMSIEELFTWLTEQAGNPLLGAVIGEEGKQAIGQMGGLLTSVKDLLTGPTHSLAMLSTGLPVEGEETTAFLEEMNKQLSENTVGRSYLIGNSPMNLEMQKGFDRELLTISLLTAASIFLVVLVTFRNAVIPVLLVLLVQCGVFLTVSTTWLLGYRMYYLAILIVQCILMGATVDYGILFTNYYRELRQRFSVAETLREAYQRAIHTILTSAMFMVFVTGVIGFSPAEPTITQICRSISIGAASATILVIFVLPGVLAALDRFTGGRWKKEQ